MDDYAKKVLSVLTAIMVVGIFLPLMITNIEHHVITRIYYYPEPSFENVSLSVDIADEFNTRFYNNLSLDAENMTINYDVFNNLNTSGSSVSIDKFNQFFQSIFTPKNATFTGFLSYYRILSSKTPQMNYTIYNAFYDETHSRYEPNEPYAQLDYYPHLTLSIYYTLNLTNASIFLDTSQTEGNMFFMRYGLTDSSSDTDYARLVYNATLHNSLTYKFSDPTWTTSYDFKTKYYLSLNASASYEIENENATISTAIIGGQNTTSIYSIFRGIAIQNDSINGCNYDVEFITDSDIPLNVLFLSIGLSFMDVNVSFADNIFFDGVELYVFEKNNAYNVSITAADFYLNDFSGNFYSNYWNVGITVYCTINAVENEFIKAMPSFYYLY